MGVLRVLEGCCRVFEVCLEGVWKNKLRYEISQTTPPSPVYEMISQIFFTNDGFPKESLQAIPASVRSLAIPIILFPKARSFSSFVA